MIEMFHLGHLQTLALQQCGWYCYIQRFDELSSASSSSSITHRLSSASLMWLFVPFGSRSVAHEKLISARCVLPSFLCTFTIRQQAAVVTTAKGHISYTGLGPDPIYSSYGPPPSHIPNGILNGLAQLMVVTNRQTKETKKTNGVTTLQIMLNFSQTGTEEGRMEGKNGKRG